MRNKFIALLLSAFLVLPVNAAVDCNGNQNKIEVTDNDTIEPTDMISVAFWIKLDAAASEFDSPISATSGGSWVDGFGFFFRATTDTLTFWVQSWNANFATVPYDVTGADFDDDWHHIVGAWDGTTVRIYKDGVVSATTDAFAGAITYPGATLRICKGESSTATNYTLNGKVDEMQVWNRALSAAEIESLYESRARLQLTDGRLAYWPLDDAITGQTPTDGWTFHDISGNGNTATWAGGDGDAIPGSILRYP